MPYLVFLFLLAVLVAVFNIYKEDVVSYFKKPGKHLSKTKKSSALKGKDFIAQLEKANYFKYTNQDLLEQVKLEMEEQYSSNGGMPTVWDDSTYHSMDMRGYFCDGEEVYEEGGVTGMLREDLVPIFKVLGLTISIEEHYEDYTRELGSNHFIVINGTKHTIFKNYNGGDEWGVAPKRLAEILNFELEKQDKKERVYLALAANDGLMYFFTEEQYKIIDAALTDNDVKPLPPDVWFRVMKGE